MRVAILCMFLGLSPVSGFVSRPPVFMNQAMRMSSTEGAEAATGEKVPIVLTGKNIDLTQALVDYVNKRIGGNLNKLTSNGAIKECDVHLSVNKNPKVKNGHRVEVTTNLKGTTIHSRTETADMYESIDAVAHALNRKLRKYKERRMEGWHGGGHMGDDLMKAFEEFEAEQDWSTSEDDDDFADPEAPTITKVKSFALDKPIKVEEAIFALDYTDHDFYVFRNADSNEINVVYKRNVGGIGHVEP